MAGPLEDIKHIEKTDQAVINPPEHLEQPMPADKTSRDAALHEVHKLSESRAADALEMERHGELPPTRIDSQGITPADLHHDHAAVMCQAPKDSSLNLGRPADHYFEPTNGQGQTFGVFDEHGKATTSGDNGKTDVLSKYPSENLIASNTDIKQVSDGSAAPVAAPATRSDAGGEMPLQGYVSNVPEVSKPISSLEDANRLVSGAAQAGMEMIQSTVAHLSQKGAVERDLLSIGPAMDKYTNHPEQLGRDAGYVLKAALDHLDKPMSPETRGHDATMMSPWFMTGVKNSVSEATAAEKAGVSVQELRNMSEADRMARGVEFVPKQYADAFFEKHRDLMPFRDEMEVHHAIPQAVSERCPGLFTAKEIHDVASLRGIPNDAMIDRQSVHKLITQSWKVFLRENENPSRLQILEHVKHLDDTYGSYFIPPTR